MVESPTPSRAGRPLLSFSGARRCCDVLRFLARDYGSSRGFTTATGMEQLVRSRIGILGLWRLSGCFLERLIFIMFQYSRLCCEA